MEGNGVFERRLAEIKELHETDKHLGAARRLEKLENDLLETVREGGSDEKVREAQNVLGVLRGEGMKSVRDTSVEVLSLRQCLNEKSDDWILSYSGSETNVWYRREPNTASHTILTEGEIRAPLMNVAVLLYEADLYDRLFWYVTSAKELAVRGATWLKRAAHILVYAPWPLYKRDVAVYAYAVDALDEEESCVMVVSRSVKEGDGVDLKDIPVVSRSVRVDMTKSGFEMRPSGPGVVKARFLYNVDPHLSFVPMALINWVARTLCRWSLRVLESRARDLSKMPPEYQHRLATKPVYAHIRARLDEFWESKGLSQEAAKVEEDRVLAQHRRSHSFDPDVTPSGISPAIIKQIARGDSTSSSNLLSPRKSVSRLFTSKQH